MLRTVFYIAIGYMLGGILFAPITARLLGGGSITEKSADKNPGVANAFTHGGALCGSVALALELLKGAVPVAMFVFLHPEDPFTDPALALVMAAPVIGHILPAFNRFKGGKGIAVSFGVLLGLAPRLAPLLVLAGSFIFFSVVVRISPHIFRTQIAYITAEGLMLIYSLRAGCLTVWLGFTIIVISICLRLYHSTEEREKVKINLLWTH